MNSKQFNYINLGKSKLIQKMNSI